MSHHTRPATDNQQYRQELTAQIFNVLRCNGSNARGVYFSLDTLPKGGMNALLRQRPLDGVRAEIGGTTVTVEITTERQGEQPDYDALRFATYDFEAFRIWLYNLLRKSGTQPVTPEYSNQPTSRPTSRIRPDQRSRPTFKGKK